MLTCCLREGKQTEFQSTRPSAAKISFFNHSNLRHSKESISHYPQSSQHLRRIRNDSTRPPQRSFQISKSQHLNNIIISTIAETPHPKSSLPRLLSPQIRQYQYSTPAFAEHTRRNKVLPFPVSPTVAPNINTSNLTFNYHIRQYLNPTIQILSGIQIRPEITPYHPPQGFLPQVEAVNNHSRRPPGGVTPLKRTAFRVLPVFTRHQSTNERRR